jgi:serine/threonine protein kinase/WD40 repeat protein
MPKPPLWRLEELFHQAVALDPPRRPAFLDTACAGDAELRAAVEDLLKHDRDHDSSDKSFVSPVAGQVERLMPMMSTFLDVVKHRPGPAPPQMPTIAGYELLEAIGRGGMGIVYKARQISLNRIVALKMLLAIQPISTEELVRFRIEAEALARLRHPNIVTIFEIAESEGRPYFTMEYIAGPSLADVLKGHPQDVAATARLLEIVARAVHAIHECGYIHRDLKPANVLLQRKSEVDTLKSDEESNVSRSDFGFRISDFEPKITDFGIAKDQDDQHKLTKTGAVMGTPSYMAPEQARGDATIGPATDICSLGAILYEMLTGRPPFDAGDPTITLAQLLNAEPLSPLRLRPNLPRDVATICLKCLEKLPRKRYQTALELAEDLQRFQAGKPIHARPVRFPERVYRWCRRRPLVAGLLALSTLLALTCIATVIVYEIRLNAALKTQIAEEDKQIVEQKDHIVQLHVEIGIAALEEGETFAAVFHFTEALRLDEGSEREGRHRLRIGAALRQCPWPTAVISLEREVLCAEHDRVVTISANGSLEVRGIPAAQPIVSSLTQTEMPSEGALSPDGHFLGVLSGKAGAIIWDLSNRQPHHLASADRSEVKRLMYHPNGHVLLMQHSNGTLEEWDLKTWTQLPWEALTKEAIFSTFSDDGRWLLTCDADHSGRVWDMGTGKSTGAVLNFGHRVHVGTVAPDGRTVAVIGPENDLSIWDVPACRRIGKTIRLPDAVRRIAISPEADRVATIGQDHSLHLWQMQLGVLLSQNPMPDDATPSLRFSADGHHLLTMGEIGGARVFDAVTGHAVTPPLRQGGRLISAEFRANGREVATVSKSGIVCAWELPHGPEVRHGATGALVSNPAKSASSRSISLANGITVRTDGASDGPLSPPARGGLKIEKAVLSPDGSRVALCEDATTVLLCDTSGRDTNQAALRHRSPVRYAAFSADGQRILTACNDRTVRLWDATTGELLSPPMRHSHDIRRVAFDATAPQAQVMEEDGTVCLWELKEDNHSLDALLALAQIVAGEHAEANQGRRQLDPKTLRENWERLSSAK